MKAIKLRFGGRATIDVFNLGAIDGEIDVVKQMLTKCKCSTIDIDYEWDFDFPTLKTPAGVIWDLPKDRGVMEDVWKAMGKDRIPVNLTDLNIHVNGSPNNRGASITKEGILIDASNPDFFFFPRVLAHELGHYADYVGQPPDNHSPNADNIMSIVPGDTPDTQYCTKVAKLAR